MTKSPPHLVHEQVMQDGTQPRANPFRLLQGIRPAQRALDAILHQIVRLAGAPDQPGRVAPQGGQLGDQVLRENAGPP